jgi:hypothetical protein
VVDSCECGDETSGSVSVGNFLSSSGTVSFSGRTLLRGVTVLYNSQLWRFLLVSVPSSTALLAAAITHLLCS